MATVKTTYLGNLRTEPIHLQSGTTIITDAPIDNQGKGEAFSPTDLLATALGSCMMTIMGIVAQRDGVQFEGTTFETTKIMSQELPRRVVRIEVVFTMVTTAPLTVEEQKKYEKAAYTCPVALSLNPEIEQVVTFNW